MTTIEMDNYMDDNLAVWNPVTGYRQQVELCKELRRKREARQRAKAIQRERRRRLAKIVTEQQKLLAQHEALAMAEDIERVKTRYVAMIGDDEWPDVAPDTDE